jgi:putative SOS response-associated peptidase YedK
MIICEPNEFVAEVHDRMPVMLKPEQFEHWLSGNMGVEELKPVENGYLQRWPVSKRVNSSKAPDDDPTLIERSDGVIDQAALLAMMHAVGRRIGNIE